MPRPYRQVVSIVVEIQKKICPICGICVKQNRHDLRKTHQPRQPQMPPAGTQKFPPAGADGNTCIISDYERLTFTA